MGFRRNSVPGSPRAVGARGRISSRWSNAQPKDQHYGGLIVWLPGTLTSFAAMIAVLMVMRLNEERAEHARQTD